MMVTPTLTLPEEPRALKSMARTLLDQAPETGLPLVVGGEWIADPLWECWGDLLREHGMDRERFGQIVAGYGNELRLWVVGERPWQQYISGLAGRVDAAVVSVSDSPRGTEPTSPGATPWVASASPRTTRWPDSSRASASCISCTTSPRRTGKEDRSRVRAPPPPSSGPVAVLATRRFRSGRAAPDHPRRRWRRHWGDSCSRTRPTRRDMHQADQRRCICQTAHRPS